MGLAWKFYENRFAVDGSSRVPAAAAMFYKRNR